VTQGQPRIDRRSNTRFEISGRPVVRELDATLGKPAESNSVTLPRLETEVDDSQGFPDATDATGA
jgi:hypothetical protein